MEIRKETRVVYVTDGGEEFGTLEEAQRQEIVEYLTTCRDLFWTGTDPSDVVNALLKNYTITPHGDIAIPFTPPTN